MDNPLVRQRSPDWGDWRWQLSHTVRSLDELGSFQEAKTWIDSLPESEITQLATVMSSYQMGVTPYYLSLIESYDYSDPIFSQIIPQRLELITTADELEDPIGDANPELSTQPVSTITHRYRDRVLFYPIPNCAVYCRFCFRKRLVGQAAFVPKPAELEAGFHYIEHHPEIKEVILTGGDPLMLSDIRLTDILTRLSTIEHVEILRIHSRLPVVNPFRLTHDLARRLETIGKPLRIVTHFNHPAEVTATAVKWIKHLISRGINVLNQTVLLNGVNAHPDILEVLFTKLVEGGIQPYYLHHPDKVRGTSHFRMTLEAGQEIYRELLHRLPDHAVPRYVLDLPGGYGKIPVTGDTIRKIADGHYMVKTTDDLEREYED